MNGLSPAVLFARRLQPHHPIPPTPTNDERVRAYRAIAPVQPNGRHWKWHKTRTAA